MWGTLGSAFGEARSVHKERDSELTATADGDNSLPVGGAGRGARLGAARAFHRGRLWQVPSRSTRQHRIDVAAILRHRHRAAVPFTQALTGPPH